MAIVFDNQFLLQSWFYLLDLNCPLEMQHLKSFGGSILITDLADSGFNSVDSKT